MASNTRSVPDITDFEDYPDWIELHNAGADAISLDGYFLSDNPNSPFNPLSPHLRFLQRRPKALHLKSKFLATSHGECSR